MKHGSRVVFVLGLLAFSACSGHHGGPALERFIKVEPQEILKFPQMKHLDWDFSTPNAVRSWKLAGPELASRAGPRGLEIYSSGHCSLSSSMQFAALSAGQVELDVEGLKAGDQLRLCWDLGAGFSSSRCVGIKSLRSQKHFVFLPSSSSGWRDVIFGLRLTVVSQGPRHLKLQRLRVSRTDNWSGKLTEASKRAWKIDGSGDVRNGRLGMPGHPMSWEVVLPRNAVLKFSCARLGPSGDPVFFVIREYRQSNKSHVVFRQELGSVGDVVGSPWRDFSLSLPGAEGDEVRLEFETEISERARIQGAIAAWADPKIVAPAEADTPPDMILISIDTLRADHLGIYGGRRGVSPHIDSWAENRAFVFENCVAPSPWTLPSHVSMLSGMGPFSHPFHYPMRVGPSMRSLAEILRAGGYATMALTGGGYLRPRFGFAQGFDQYKYWFGPKEDELSTHVQEALGWLRRKSSQPRFLFLHTFEVHGPYAPAEPYFSRFSNGAVWPDGWQLEHQRVEGGEERCFSREKKCILRRIDRTEPPRPALLSEEKLLPVIYDSHVAEMDEQIGIIFDALEKMGRMGTTILALTSDHGEGLGEQGHFGHAYLYDFNLMVPLMISGPGIDRPGRSGRQVQLIDLVPTLLDLVDAPSPEGLDGRSLVPLMRGKTDNYVRDALSYAASTSRGISIRRANREKFILNNSAAHCPDFREEFYDLSKDPRELENLAQGSSDLQEWREEAMAAYVAAPIGVAIEVHNEGSEVVVFRFSGEALKPRRLKFVRLPVPDIRWEGSSALLRMLPDSGAELRLEGPEEGVLKIELLQEDGVPLHEERIHLDALRSPVMLFGHGERWPRGQTSGTKERTGASIMIKPMVGEESSFLSQDAEAARQLRELGYVE